MTSPRTPRITQPFLLRVLHSITGVLLIAAILTAYWTYDTYDGRWGRIPLPKVEAMEGIHGTFGLLTLLIFPAFLIYAVHRGQKRLIQANSLRQLTRIGHPSWWYTLNRWINTSALVLLTFALFSGKMMGEQWLPQGELDHAWYLAHLLSWLLMVVAIVLHIAVNFKVGGVPFLVSMWHWRYQRSESPYFWPSQIAQGWVALRQGTWLRWFQPLSGLMVLELGILASLAIAWILPLLKDR
ncbi:cytochrome b/b6 domain-containing protein [Synechococcus elongatus]|uniref:cytochrome b/b6 domain-containing protein n=1 Tax=Synechococcus elongatus TaxID=32046 RepID=UPI0030CAB7F0